jgi:hypothetical protein
VELNHLYQLQADNRCDSTAREEKRIEIKGKKITKDEILIKSYKYKLYKVYIIEQGCTRKIYAFDINQKQPHMAKRKHK